jgi:hypothetical protein
MSTTRSNIREVLLKEIGATESCSMGVVWLER